MSAQAGAAPAATADDVRRAVAGLGEARATLVERPWRDVLESLGAVGARFLEPADPLRQAALEGLPAEASLSPEMARRVLDGMARDWTADRLHSMLAAELEQPDCLDRPGMVGGRRLMAVGPALCLQVVAGSVPGVGVHALLRSLILKAPTLLKPGAGDVLLPTLFAKGLGESDPGLARALAVLYWPGGATGPLQAALDDADVAVVYGSDDTVRNVRTLAPATTRVVTYHHRIGVGVVGRAALGDSSIRRVALELATAVALFEQRGCVCPHHVWVEGAPADAQRFSSRLAEAFAALEDELPSAPLALEERAALQQLRGTAEMTAAAAGGGVRHGGSASWTVIFEPDAAGGPPTLARGVRVRPIGDVLELPAVLAPLGRHLQTVGHAGVGPRLYDLSADLARTGASRIVPFRRMSFPPPWWLHDGRGPLRELVRWAEIEADQGPG